MNLPKRLRSLIQEQGMSKQQLGRILDPSLTTPQGRIKKVNRILNAKHPKIDLESIQALSEHFNKPLEWFYYPEKEQRKQRHILSSEHQKSPTIPFLGAVSDAVVPWEADAIEDQFTYPFADTPLKEMYAIRMIGDSMKGLIPHGTYMFVQAITHIPDLPSGVPVIYRIKKSLPHIALWYPNADGTITLKSPNPEFKPITTKAEVLSVLGEVKKIFMSL